MIYLKWGPAIELINSFEAKLGIFGVPGNTDHIVMDAESLARELRPAKINYLINETRKLRLPNGNFLWIIGVDDPKYKYAKVEEALEGIPHQVPKIMLAHAPYIFHDAVKNNINLLLVGDTHGGQVGVDFLIRMSDYANRTPYMRGLFQEDNTKMYVNRGIGTKTLPIRFLCRPEIAVIEVES